MGIIPGLNTAMGPMINSVSHAVGQAARQAGNQVGQNTRGGGMAPGGANIADLQRRVAELEAQVATLMQLFTATPTGLSISVAGALTVNAGIVQFNAPMVRAAGVVQTETLIASAVVSASYTPGAGNVM